MVETFRVYLNEHQLLNPQLHFVVACSGGLDSTVLCELCFQAGLRFSIAHCNFSLRGDESNRDEAFVTSLGEKYKVPVFTKTFDTAHYGVLKKLSIQEAARALRYAWLEELRNEKKAAYVLLAHHANDNIETVLMNLFRGTGLHGLTGMPERVDGARCLRPLLHHTRKEIELFARKNNLQWREDSSNQSNKYTRNFFRNAIFPAIKNVYPQAEENVLHTIARLKKTELLYEELVHGLLKKFVIENGSETKVGIAKLMQYAHTSLPYAVFKKFGFGEKQLPEILKLATSESGSVIQNENYRVIKHRNWFLISPVSSMQATTFVIEEGIKKITLPFGALQISSQKKAPFPLSKSPLIAQLDASEIHYPLLLRRWKPGDYFYPLGLRKKKKLARFFIDQKLSTLQKESVWVVESNLRIVWVVGLRIDDRFKITDATKNVLQLTIVYT